MTLYRGELTIYPSFGPHEEVVISGDIPAFQRLKGAIDNILTSNEDIAATRVFDSSGEGYILFVVIKSDFEMPSPTKWQEKEGEGPFEEPVAGDSAIGTLLKTRLAQKVKDIMAKKDVVNGEITQKAD